MMCPLATASLVIKHMSWKSRVELSYTPVCSTHFGRLYLSKYRSDVSSNTFILEVYALELDYFFAAHGTLLLVVARFLLMTLYTVDKMATWYSRMYSWLVHAKATASHGVRLGALRRGDWIRQRA